MYYQWIFPFISSLSVMPIILCLRKGCAKLMAYWKTKFNYPVEQELDYTSYTNLFFAASPDETDDEVLLSSLLELLNEGYGQVDIDLYCAAERIQYGEVERLLKLGADPEVDIDDCKAMSRILCDLIGCAAHEKMYDLLTRKF